MNTPSDSKPRKREVKRARRARRARSAVKVLPSMFTLANLLCGFAAIFYASRPEGAEHVFNNLSLLTIAALLIFAGMIFDALDGRVARLTRNTSDLGEQLDSMSDMVTFGIAPAFLVIQLINIGTPFFGPESEPVDKFFDRFVLVVAGIYAACTALRLARFNVEIDEPSESDHMSFKGLPSPAAGGTVAVFVLLHQSLIAGSSFDHARTVALFMVGITLLAALGMVSTYRYSHLLNRYLRGQVTFRTLAACVILVALLAVHPQLFATIALSAYALSGPVVHWLNRARGAAQQTPDDDEDDGDDDDADSSPLRFGGS